MRQLLNVSHAEVLVAHSQDELLDLLAATTVLRAVRVGGFTPQQ
jgi:hypothetical protein